MKLPDWPLIRFLKVFGRAISRTLGRRPIALSSEQREGIKQHMARSLATWWSAEAILKRLHAPETMQGTGVAEAILEFNREYLSEPAKSSEQLLALLHSTETELEYLQPSRGSADEAPEEYLTRIWEYHQAHPGSRLGRGFLINALKKAGHIDEAILLCGQALSPENSLESLTSNYHTHHMLGALLLEKEDWDGVIQQRKLAEACKQEEQESFLPLQILIAKARQARGDESGALHLFRKCLRSTSELRLQEVIQRSRAEVGL